MRSPRVDGVVPSSALDAWTLAMTLPSAGFSTSSVAPDAESTHSPPMNC
jgi:hypothetical protein